MRFFSFAGAPPPWSELEAGLVALHRTTTIDLPRAVSAILCFPDLR